MIQRRALYDFFPQGNYAMLRGQHAEITKAWKKSLSTGELTKLETFKSAPIIPRGNPNDPGFQERLEALNRDQAERTTMAKKLLAQMCVQRHPQPPTLLQDVNKAGGVYTSLGYNFYDLRAPVQLLFPVNTAFRNTLPRIGPVNAGTGVLAHWQGTRNPGIPYAGVSEGNRGAIGTPDDNFYFALYKEVGVERSVTFTAQFAGEGYADNLADEHIRGLFSLYLQEEGMIINGNAGSGSNLHGFQLGTPGTPTGAVTATHTVGAAGSGSDLPYGTALTTSNYVSVAVVALTANGNPTNTQYGYGLFPTIASGLTPSYVRNNADGSQDTIYGGLSAISAMSSPVQATTNNLTIKFQIPSANLPMKGAFGYAWYVDVETSNTGTLANAKLAGITQFPFCYISGTPTGTQVGTAAGLSVDNSAQPLDFDGLLAYSASTAGATYTDLYGASLTSQKNGRVTEIETILQSIWTQYQAGVDEIWGSVDAIEALDAAVRYSGTQASAMQMFFTRDQVSNLIGGFVVASYQSRFAFANPTGANAIPIRIHPMVPAGTLYFHIKTNPYPHSRIPFVAGMMMQRDYYSIEWPQVTRQWPFGTYVHEALAHTVPWIPAVLTGIGTFVGN